MKRGGQHEPEHDADAAPDEREEVGEVGDEHRHETHGQDEYPAQPPGIALAAEQALGDLVDRVHHHRHGEEEVDAEAELHGDGEPAGPEVCGDDVPRGRAERKVPHGAEQPVHGGDEGHGQRERAAEPALVGGLRLQRQDHADALEGVDGDAEAVEELGRPREGEHGRPFREHDGRVLAQHDAHGADVDDVGEDAERGEQRERLDGVEPELERQHRPDEDRLGREERGRRGSPDRVQVRERVGDEEEVADAEAGLAEHEHGVDGVPPGGAVHGLAQIPERGDLGVLVREAAACGDEEHHAVEGERGDGEQDGGPRRPPRAGEGVGEAEHARADHRDEDVGERLGLRRQPCAAARVLRQQQRRRVDEPRRRGARLLVEPHGGGSNRWSAESAGRAAAGLGARGSGEMVPGDLRLLWLCLGYVVAERCGHGSRPRVAEACRARVLYKAAKVLVHGGHRFPGVGVAAPRAVSSGRLPGTLSTVHRAAAARGLWPGTKTLASGQILGFVICGDLVRIPGRRLSPANRVGRQYPTSLSHLQKERVPRYALVPTAATATGRAKADRDSGSDASTATGVPMHAPANRMCSSVINTTSLSPVAFLETDAQ
jgi:hypothetical protein